MALRPCVRAGCPGEPGLVGAQSGWTRQCGFCRATEGHAGGFPQKSRLRAGFPGITGKARRRGQCAKCVVLVGTPGVCWWQSFWGNSLCLCQKEETTFWGNHCSLRGQINTPIPICPSRVLSLPRCPQPGASAGHGQAAREGPSRLWSAVFPKSRRQAGCPSLSQ